MDYGDVITIEESLGLVEVFDGTGNLVTIFQPTVDVVQIVTTDLTGPQGPPGIAGPPGVPGEQGPKGDTGPFAPQFEQTFAAPLTTWFITHNMDVFPVVKTFDSHGFEISGDVTMPDRNTVVVAFEVPMSGTARLKA